MIKNSAKMNVDQENVGVPHTLLNQSESSEDKYQSVELSPIKSNGSDSNE